MKTAALGEIATIERRSVSPDSIDPDNHYVGLENITSGGEFRDVGLAGGAELKSNKFRFGPEHILYGKLRPYLSKIAQPTFVGVCSTDILPIKVGPNVDQRFLLHYLRTPSMVGQAEKNSSGANLPRLSPKALAAFEIPLPSIEEQRRIAAVLDAADSLRAKRRKGLARLNSLPGAIFIDMFGESSDSLADLGDVAEVQGGLQITSKRRSNPVEVPYLRVANVHRGFLDLDEIKTMRVTNSELARTKLTDGDLLVVEGHGNAGEIGRVGIWDGSISPCVHQNHLIRVRCDTGRVLPQFVEAFMNSWVGRRALLRAANTTSGLNTISTSDVRTVQVPLAPMERQLAFQGRLRKVELVRQATRSSEAEFNTLFQSLQQRAFRGEL